MMLAGADGMLIVICVMVLALDGGRTFYNRVRTNAVSCAEENRQNSEKNSPENASDHALTSLSDATIYTPNGYMSMLENHV